MKLYPRCISGNKPPAYSSTGYILPCCWCDDDKVLEEFDFIMKEHLKLENVETIDDIFLSEEWIDFFKMLNNNSNDAPFVCKKYCSKDWETKRIVNE
tara:strand:- start:425 stop:715 length:291 start_codon:yes stop_codon:yes gene_type:complete